MTTAIGLTGSGFIVLFLAFAGFDLFNLSRDALFLGACFLVVGGLTLDALSGILTSADKTDSGLVVDGLERMGERR